MSWIDGTRWCEIQLEGFRSRLWKTIFRISNRKYSPIFKCDMLALALLRTEIFFLLALRQNLDKNQNLDKQIILPKNSSQKFLPKNSSPKNPPKKFQKFPKDPKNLKQFLKKFLRFWKSPIPYIALGGWKPFRACWITKPTKKLQLSFGV